MGAIERELSRGRRSPGGGAGAPGRSYPIVGAPAGARVLVRVPARFFGRWKFTIVFPGVPDVRVTARVYCGKDHRLKFEWSKNPGAGLMRALTLAANAAVADLGGADRCG